MHGVISATTVHCDNRVVPRAPNFICVRHRLHRQRLRELRVENRVSQRHGGRGKPPHALLSRSTPFTRGAGRRIRVSVGPCAIGGRLLGVCAPVFAVESVASGLDCCGGAGCGMVAAHAGCIPSAHGHPSAGRVRVRGSGVSAAAFLGPRSVPRSVPDQIAILGIRVLDGSSAFTFACVMELVWFGVPLTIVNSIWALA